jgi:osmotically-inducible protein OsmY
VLADLALQAHVRAALRHDPRTEKANVGIDAKDRRVILSGVLDAGMDESATLAVVNSVDGVVEIETRLRSATLPRYKLDS